MKTQFKNSFFKDLRHIQDRDLLSRIKQVIESVEQAQDLAGVAHLKKLRGGDRFYRIRLGDYRIGLILEKGTVSFVRALHRRDIYRHFP